jgi:hypothetical protein
MGVDALCAAWVSYPVNCKPLLLGDLNINLRDPCTKWEETIADFLDDINFVNLSKKHNRWVATKARDLDGLSGSREGDIVGTNPRSIFAWLRRGIMGSSKMWRSDSHESMT